METTQKPATPERRRAPDGLVPDLNGIELRRAYRIEGLEWREPGEETGGDYYTLAGHAAVFDVLSLPLWDWWFGEYREKIDAAAFDNVLARNPDVHLVYCHDMSSAMARTASKTLDLRVDPKGLRVWSQLSPKDLDVQRIAPKMDRRDVDQMSFAFTVARDEWLVETNGDEEIVTRTILEIGELYDVSVVPQGAYPQTDAGLRERVYEARGLIRAAVREGRIANETPEERRDGPDPSGAPEAGDVAPDDLAGDPDVTEADERAAVRAKRARVMRNRIAVAKAHL